MSRTSRRIGSRALRVLGVLTAAASLGCWEQWSVDWFPQMKWQKAVQAYESVELAPQPGQGRAGAIDPFLPPEGTVPIDGGEAAVSNVVDAESDVLVNPRAMNLASVENGRIQYVTFCAACHGDQGLGDGSVSMTGSLSGPIAAVLPINGAGSIAKVRSDGHIYTTIRYGRRRMPGYQRIASEDRWDIVNYLRYLNAQKGIEP